MQTLSGGRAAIRFKSGFVEREKGKSKRGAQTGTTTLPESCKCRKKKKAGEGRKDAPILEKEIVREREGLDQS